MSQANPDNELNRLRRDNARLLKRLLDVMDVAGELRHDILSLDDRVLKIETLLTDARANSEKRRGNRQHEPTNQVAAATE